MVCKEAQPTVNVRIGFERDDATDEMEQTADSSYSLLRNKGREKKPR